MVRIVEWFCERKGWQAVPADRLHRERERGLAIAALDLVEVDLFEEMQRQWDAAEDKPETLGYFWQGLQELDHERRKATQLNGRTTGMTALADMLPKPKETP